MMRRDQFVTTARSFIGTPFVHQGRLPGTALDCAGLVVCSAQACGHDLKDREAYPDVPDSGDFVRCVEENGDRIDLTSVRPGDLMIFAWTRHPQHIAIVTQIDPLQIVHSWSDPGRAVENGFDAYWRRRLRGCYRLRGIV